MAEQVFHLCRVEVGGRSAAPVELDDRALPGNALADVLDFPFQCFEIRDHNPLVFLNRNIARAEQAEVFAKRQMHVERNGSGGSLGASVIIFEIVRAEIFLPDRSGGIAGVARAGAIVLL
jgi:hypothetical protein